MSFANASELKIVSIIDRWGVGGVQSIVDKIPSSDVSTKPTDLGIYFNEEHHAYFIRVGDDSYAEYLVDMGHYDWNHYTLNEISGGLISVEELREYLQKK